MGAKMSLKGSPVEATIPAWMQESGQVVVSVSVMLRSFSNVLDNTNSRSSSQSVTTFPASQAASSDRRFPSTTLAFTELSLSVSSSHLLCSLISFATWQIFVQPFRNSQRLPEQPHPGYLPVVIEETKFSCLMGRFSCLKSNTQSKFAIWLNRFCIMRWLRLTRNNSTSTSRQCCQVSLYPGRSGYFFFHLTFI